MPTITNYATLSTAITDFTHRSDLASFVDYFIQGAQEDIHKDIFDKNEGNAIKAMEAAFTPAAIDGSGHFAVPSDYLSLKNMEVTVGQNLFELTEKGIQWIYGNYPKRAPDGIPAYVAREGSNFIFGPYPDSAYTIQGYYYQLAPLLSGSQTTNWIVLKAPMLLLAACMRRAKQYLQHLDVVAYWQGEYDKGIDTLVNEDKAERWNASTLQVERG